MRRGRRNRPLQVGQRIHRGRRVHRPLPAAKGILPEKLMMADDDRVERLDKEALVHVADRQVKVARHLAVDLLDDLGDPLYLGGALAVQGDAAAFFGPLDQLFEGGLVSGP